MEQPLPPASGSQRPRTLTWLCIASFANQALVFPLYLLGVGVAWYLKGQSVEAIEGMMNTAYARFIQPDQREQLLQMAPVLKQHGVALMAVFALRTAARFVGTLRMWQGWKDGFHIYTSAQLLGMLLPILLIGPKGINFIGFILALNWCYLYFIHRHALKDARQPA